MNVWEILNVIALILVVLYSLNTVIAQLVFGAWHRGSLVRGAAWDRAVALTFHGGPESVYTAQLLDALRDLDVHATFFVDAKEAAESPALLAQMIADGHEIGMRGWGNPVHPWFQTPMATFRDIRKGLNTLEELTGKHVRFYRPPQGAFNLAARYACTFLGLTPTLWSVADWGGDDLGPNIGLGLEPGSGPNLGPNLEHDLAISLGGDAEATANRHQAPLFNPKSVAERIVRGVGSGSIIYCGDLSAGNSHGPAAGEALRYGAGNRNGAGAKDKHNARNLAAVPETVHRLRQLGYRFSTVGELADVRAKDMSVRKGLFRTYPLWRKCLIGAWSIVEFAFAKFYHVQGVNAIYRVSPTTWRHGPRFDADGRLILADGVPALDLHFHNSTLIAIANAKDQRALVRALRMARDGLADIARILLYHPDFAHVKVVAAPTLMNRGVEMLGFHVEDLPPTRANRRLQGYMRFLMGMYHPDGFRRLREGTRALDIKLVWMTKEELIHRSGVAEPVASGAGEGVSPDVGNPVDSTDGLLNPVRPNQSGDV